MKRLLALLLMPALLLAGCGSSGHSDGTSSQEAASATLFAMDTVMEVTVYGDEELLSGAEELIYSIEDAMSVTDENSEIYKLNQDGAVTLSELASDIVGSALEMCSRTGGALDISIYPVVRAWGFTTGDYGVPEDSEIQSLLENVDYTQINYDSSTGEISLSAEMEIDLGSVTKGYTGDSLVEYFSDNGVTSALINLGGNVQALGTKPDGSAWRIGIQDPVGDSYFAILEIEDKAVITSGGYERYFEEDGVTYWHIIDPSTGYPADSGLISVTVVGDSGLVCDALSTSLFVMGLDDALELWAESDDFEAIFVSEDGSITITEGIVDSFTLTGDYTDTEVRVATRG